MRSLRLRYDGQRPHVDEVRVAHAVGQQARHPDDAVTVARDRDVLRLFEGALQRRGRASVVEVVGREVGFGRRPVDTGEVVVDAHRHALMMTQARYFAVMTSETDVERLYRDLLSRWNERDAAGFGALFAGAGSIVGFDGSCVESPTAITEHLASIFADHQPATYVAKVREVRPLGPGASLSYRQAVGLQKALLAPVPRSHRAVAAIGGALGEIRTHTVRVLNPFPLPVGIRGRGLPP